MRISGLTHSRHSIVQDNALSLFFYFFLLLFSFRPFPSSNFLRPLSFSLIVLYRASSLPRSPRIFSGSPDLSPSLRSTSLPSCPPSSFVSSSSPRSLPQLSVSLPSFLCPSSFYLLPPFSPLSFPPLPFLPSPSVALSRSISLPVPSSLSHLLISLRTSGMRGLFIQERSLRRWLA